MPGRAVSIVVALLVVLAVLLLAAHARVQEQERALEGFWVASPEFLDESGLSDMCLYLGPPEGETRPAHLSCARADGAALYDGPATLSYGGAARRRWAALAAGLRGPYRVPAAALRAPGDRPLPFLPPEAELVLDPATGSLVLHAGGKAYAHLYRDGPASAACAI